MDGYFQGQLPWHPRWHNPGVVWVWKWEKACPWPPFSLPYLVARTPHHTLVSEAELPSRMRGCVTADPPSPGCMATKSWTPCHIDSESENQRIIPRSHYQHQNPLNKEVAGITTRGSLKLGMSIYLESEKKWPREKKKKINILYGLSIRAVWQPLLNPSTRLEQVCESLIEYLSSGGKCNFFFF